VESGEESNLKGNAAAHGTGKESGAGSRPATDPKKAQSGRAVRRPLPSITCTAATTPWQQRRHGTLLLRSCQWLSICAASWHGLLRSGLTQGGCRSICQQVLQDLRSCGPALRGGADAQRSQVWTTAWCRRCWP
jgi:hypothetical protein